MNKDPRLLERIENALTQIRPYLEADGGNVSVIGVTGDMTLQLRLHGACRSCAMSMMTLKAGIEQAVIHAVPEIKSVESVSDEAFERQLLRKETE